MIYKTYKCNSFNVHTIKTDKFKTAHMEIMFRKNVVKDELCAYTFLMDMLSESCCKYKTKRDLIVRFEELYKASCYGITVKTGNVLNSTMVVDFINPKFIDEDNYLEEVLKLPIDMLQSPNVVNEEFDLKQFNIVRERLIRDINSIKDNAFKYAIRNAFNVMDKNSPTAFSILGTLEDVERITPASLYKTYKSLFKDCVCDIFVIGDMDMDEVVSIIRKHFKYRIINNTTLNLMVDNNVRKKAIIKSDKSENIQANLVMLYNVLEVSEKEKHVTTQVFNYIFGNGGLTSKLYKSIREENSLCYSISSLYMKYDKLLVIHVSLDQENVDKASKLVKKCLNMMVNGDFTEEDINDAKTNLVMSLDLANDNNVAILNNYVFNKFDNLPELDERKEMIKKVTKEDIINVAKKIKLNTIYVLEGGK